MTNPDQSATAFTAADLAERFGLRLQGDGAIRVEGVAPLARAGAQELAFLSNPRLRAQLLDSGAGVAIVRPADAEGLGARTLLLADDPYVAYAKVAALFEPRRPLVAGIHPSAVVDATAQVDPEAEIGPQCYIGPRTRIAAGCVIGPGCVIGEDCVLDRDCVLVARVTLDRRVRLGARVQIQPGAVLGAEGFGMANEGGRWIKVPQLGGVVCGDDVEIGANTTIDRGTLDDTVLEHGVRLDNLIQIAHNVHIGAHTAMAGCVGIAGSTRIGSRCLIAGKVGISGHLEICDNVLVHAMSMVAASITEPGEYSSGMPAMATREWRRNAARIRQLDTLARRVGALEKGRE
ncbi:UDP-3-O-(3-hydroxymyristoyl)glucosamine N-acyltransferase [Luteimonas abyssi]|uniref:UDP-3-O-(3-hydroxymyristoyl)glucosamine N-acyltransferase n=1 Tax=Luteimonas abyssi TaxID=1247514 RepID=UPI000737B5DA|nr:UDP-3-O-(3-hydroxymyristoyl)glucosamine N-acyltransferase [Luteimonas abyssi]